MQQTYCTNMRKLKFKEQLISTPKVTHEYLKKKSEGRKVLK